MRRTLGSEHRRNAVVLALIGAGVWEAVTAMGSMPHL